MIHANQNSTLDGGVSEALIGSLQKNISSHQKPRTATWGRRHHNGPLLLLLQAQELVVPQRVDHASLLSCKIQAHSFSSSWDKSCRL